MNSTVFIALLVTLSVGMAMTMPEQTAQETTPQSLTHEEDDEFMENDDYDDDAVWTMVGEVLEAEENDTVAENEEDLLEDMSDPPVLSEDLCSEVFDVLSNMPEGLKKSLEDMKDDMLDLPPRKEPCFRARYYKCRNFRFPTSSLCNGPYFVMYRNSVYCCRNSRRKHPLVERKGRFLRCRC